MKLDIVKLANDFFNERLKPGASWAVNDLLVDFGTIVANLIIEECAKVCESQEDFEYATGKVDHNERSWCSHLAAAIREMKSETDTRQKEISETP